VKFDRRRRQMISDIEAGVAVTRNLIGKDRLDKRVMTAMRQVHREDFVPPDMRDAAFRDGALPIGHGQTISQPYIVALMTDLLELSAKESRHLRRRLSNACKRWATIMSKPVAETVTRAGPKRRLSTASWLPPRRHMCRRHYSSNSSPAGVWSSLSAYPPCTRN